MITEKRKLKVQKKSVREKRKKDESVEVNEDSDSSGGGPSEPKSKNAKESMDYNAPKPGPHAKVSVLFDVAQKNYVFFFK